MFYVTASVHGCRVVECLPPREAHPESWDSGISALSARPNDGIHLLFYGHSWSSVAPIWPKAHNLSFSSSISLCLIPSPCSSLFYPLLSSFSHTFIAVRQNVRSTPFFPLPYSPLLFHLPSFSLWLIALMFFLWSTATSSSSELVWPHVFQEGMSRCGGEGPQGACTAKHQNNMSHSCLMTSTIQPCRALTVHLHPEGSCNMKAIHLFHTENYFYFVIAIPI